MFRAGRSSSAAAAGVWPGGEKSERSVNGTGMEGVVKVAWACQAVGRANFSALLTNIWANLYFFRDGPGEPFFYDGPLRLLVSRVSVCLCLLTDDDVVEKTTGSPGDFRIPIRLHSRRRSEEEMAVPAAAKVARALAVSAAVLVLLWCVHFRGGFSLGSPTNKGLIFNVRSLFLILPGEVAFDSIPF